MEQKSAKRIGQMNEKIIALPKIRPRQIEQERTHLQTQNDKNDAQRFIHERRSGRPKLQELASRLLKRGDAVSNIAIIDIGRIDLRKTLERRFNVTRGFLSNP